MGPVYTYLEERHQLTPALLNTNYRSNATIVSLAPACWIPSGTAPILTRPRARLYGPVTHHGGCAHGMACSDYSGVQNGRSFSISSKPCSTSSFTMRAVAASGIPSKPDAGRRPGCDVVGSNVGAAGERAGPVWCDNCPLEPTILSAADFWSRGIGVVTPHKAQQAARNGSRLQSIFGSLPGIRAGAIRDSVDTVERFQGQQRDVMLATFALGDPDAISDEDEFLLNAQSLQRHGIAGSRQAHRSRYKAGWVDHLSSDPVVLRGSALLKTFVETFCVNSRPMQLGHAHANGVRTVNGEFRWR